MEIKPDFRIRKTCAALGEALLQLMCEKRFEEITIHELCTRANVRRATFYNHFRDKNSFFSFAVRERLSHFQAEVQGDIYSRVYWETIIRRMVDFTMENRQLILNMMDSNLLSTLLSILSEQISAEILCKLKQEEKSGMALSASPVIMAHFYTGALVNTIRWWVTEQIDLAEEALVSQIMPLFMAPVPIPKTPDES